MAKPYERLKQIGWKSGNCNIDDWNIFTQSRTTYCCQELATYEVHDLSGKVIGKCCPKHGKEIELLIGAANGFVTALLSKN